MWFESPSCTKEGTLLSACPDVGTRGRGTGLSYKLSAIKEEKWNQTSHCPYQPTSQHKFPRIHPPDEAKLFFPLDSEQTTQETTAQAEGPPMTGDYALSHNTILLTAVGVDFPYCEATARGEQVCEALT